MTVEFSVDGRPVVIQTEQGSLLDALREELGIRSVKDGCSPQGQCGCCTVLVDGAPRVSCVTAVRRVAGREVTTVDGLDARTRARLIGAFVDAGASQCGFCTPGIVCRLATLGDAPEAKAVESALLAHLCRCTGWRSIVDAAVGAAAPDARGRDLDRASARATIEGGTPQRVGPEVVAGGAGFADDGPPPGALVGVPDGQGGWAVGETIAEARAAAGKVQGRRSGRDLAHPIGVPAGDWAVTLQTTWVEPAYLEPDASWCVPGGRPYTPLANGGAFGAKIGSPAPAAARALADQHGRAVRVVLSREDVVRLGGKRPPMAAGVRTDGTGLIRIARCDGVAGAVKGTAPGLAVEEVDIAGPLVSSKIRAAGWAEAAILMCGLDARLAGLGASGQGTATVRSPFGGWAEADVVVDDGGKPQRTDVTVSCGDPLDEIVLRSYVTGAAHMALGWVCSEGIAVDADGIPEDLTIRAFGILRARDTPPVTVEIDDAGGPPVNGSDAAFAAVAAATWIALGLPPRWPANRGGFQ